MPGLRDAAVALIQDAPEPVVANIIRQLLDAIAPAPARQRSNAERWSPALRLYWMLRATKKSSSPATNQRWRGEDNVSRRVAAVIMGRASLHRGRPRPAS